MKWKSKVVVVLLLLLSVFLLKTAQAESYYLPKLNMNYVRGQHWYTFKKDEVETNGIPHIYILVKDGEMADKAEEWDFNETYELPWTLNEEDYVLVLCADLDVDTLTGTDGYYERISINDATYVSEEAKPHLIAMLKNSYPFISYEEMLEKLVAEEVLVSKEVEEETYYTAASNEKPTKSVTKDEILLALKTAMAHFTNPDKIVKNYVRTYKMVTETVASKNSLWENEYEYGEHEEVKNNVEAMYNYFLTLEENEVDLSIEDVQLVEHDDDYTLNIKMNQPLTAEDHLTLKIETDKDQITEEINSKNLKDNQTIFITRKFTTIKNLNVSVEGTDYVENAVDVYEYSEGKETSQTFIGVSNHSRDVAIPFEGKIKIVNAASTENPQTGSFLPITLMAFIGLGALFLLGFIHKKNLIYKI